MNLARMGDDWLRRSTSPELTISMIETAEVGRRTFMGSAARAQDEYALQSQQRTAQAQAEGRFNAEDRRL